jgi:GMP synthase (glutamine-hydrolysing)
MRPLLIVKCGSTLPEIVERRGDFEDWIAARMPIDPTRVRVAAANADAALPAPASLAGVVVTGSAAFVSHCEAWSERTAKWLGAAALGGTPVLGICYGHQLLAHALGGRVGRNPLGREIGSIEVDLCDAARGDDLFAELPARVRVQATHVESVLALPPGARLLAASPGDPHQAFAVGERAWGVQFHPEFDADVVRGYLSARRDAVRAEGLDPDSLLRNASDSPHGAAILRRFSALLRD